MMEAIQSPEHLSKSCVREVEENVPCDVLVTTTTTRENSTPSKMEMKQKEIFNFIREPKTSKDWVTSINEVKEIHTSREFSTFAYEINPPAKTCHLKSKMFKIWEALQEDNERTHSADEKSSSMALIEESSLTIRESLKRIVKDWIEFLDLPKKELECRESLIPIEFEKSLHSIYADIETLGRKIKDLEESELGKIDYNERMAESEEEFQNLQDGVERLESLLNSRYIDINKKELKRLSSKVKLQQSLGDSVNSFTEIQFKTQSPQRRQPEIKIFATSTPILRETKVQKYKFPNAAKPSEDGMVTIGPNGTVMAKKVLESINWNLSEVANTHKILVEVFGRKTLASHSLTGKLSPAFIRCEKPIKNQLDSLKVADIIHLVTQHTHMTVEEVLNVITAKCAEENKVERESIITQAASNLNQKRKKRIIL